VENGCLKAVRVFGQPAPAYKTRAQSAYAAGDIPLLRGPRRYAPTTPHSYLLTPNLLISRVLPAGV
jgi:hypothetical protein